eukprot:364264-Chlamydomonas_euryale.AAC.2
MGIRGRMEPGKRGCSGRAAPLTAQGHKSISCMKRVTQAEKKPAVGASPGPWPPVHSLHEACRTGWKQRRPKPALPPTRAARGCVGRWPRRAQATWQPSPACTHLLRAQDALQRGMRGEGGGCLASPHAHKWKEEQQGGAAARLVAVRRQACGRMEWAICSLDAPALPATAPACRRCPFRRCSCLQLSVPACRRTCQALHLPAAAASSAAALACNCRCLPGLAPARPCTCQALPLPATAPAFNCPCLPLLLPATAPARHCLSWTLSGLKLLAGEAHLFVCNWVAAPRLQPRNHATMRLRLLTRITDEAPASEGTRTRHEH